MKRIALFVGALLLAVPIIAESQWGRGGCSAQPAVVGVPRAPVFQWKATDDALYLFRNGKQIGGYRDGVYRQVCPCGDACLCFPVCRCAEWGAVGAPPVPVPIEQLLAPKKLAVWQTHGVDPSKLNGHDGATHHINGWQVTEAEAINWIGKGGSLIDDSSKLWLIIASKDPAKRKQVIDDLNADPTLSDFRSHVWVWPTAADYWQNTDRDGKPMYAFRGDLTISLVSAQGELWHEDGYRGQLTRDDLRKADPNYSPDKSPGPKQPDPKKPNHPGVDWTAIPTGAYVLAGFGVVAAVVLIRKRK